MLSSGMLPGLQSEAIVLVQLKLNLLLNSNPLSIFSCVFHKEMLLYLPILIALGDKYDHDIGDSVAYAAHSLTHPYTTNGYVYNHDHDGPSSCFASLPHSTTLHALRHTYVHGKRVRASAGPSSNVLMSPRLSFSCFYVFFPPSEWTSITGTTLEIQL